MSSSPTVTAIMQARMGSSRLPGKVLMEVDGISFLEHAFKRLRMSRLVTTAVIATTEEPADDAIANYCADRGWPCTRGSEQDVLDRYYQTAARFPADLIVRVTSDCPLLDPSLIDEVVQLLVADFPKTDYASNVLPDRTLPRGLDVEAFTYRALERAWQEASDPAEREHVTPYLYRHPDRFNTASCAIDKDHSNHRWTLDTEEDRELLTHILHTQPEPVGWREILSLVEKHPEWSALNAHIEQKKT